MNKQEIMKAIFCNEILGDKSSNLLRKNVLRDFGDRIRGTSKKSGTFTVLVIDNRIALHVTGSIGLCTDYAIKDLFSIKMSIDEILSELHKRQVPFHSKIYAEQDPRSIVLIAKSIPVTLEFVNSDRTIGYYLQNVYRCFDEVTYKKLKLSFVN